MIVSHDFRECPIGGRWDGRFAGANLTFSPPTGLISQVAEEIWEVKNRKIQNLTKEGLTIVDYKKNLVKASTYQPKSASGEPLPLSLRPSHAFDRLCLSGKGEAVQQDNQEVERFVARSPPPPSSSLYVRP